MPARSPLLWIIPVLLFALSAGCIGFESETVLVERSESVRIPGLRNGVYLPVESGDVERAASYVGEKETLGETDGPYAMAWDGRIQGYDVFIGPDPYYARCKWIDRGVFLMMLTDIDGTPKNAGRYLYLLFKVVSPGVFQLFDQDCDLQILDDLEEEWTVETRSASEFGGDILEGKAEAILPMLYELQARMRGCEDSDLYLVHESLLLDENWEYVEIDPSLRGLSQAW